jgi:hypothetical protein
MRSSSVVISCFVSSLACFLCFLQRVAIFFFALLRFLGKGAFFKCCDQLLCFTGCVADKLEEYRIGGEGLRCFSIRVGSCQGASSWDEV